MDVSNHIGSKLHEAVACLLKDINYWSMVLIGLMVSTYIVMVTGSFFDVHCIVIATMWSLGQPSNPGLQLRAL